MEKIGYRLIDEYRASRRLRGLATIYSIILYPVFFPASCGGFLYLSVRQIILERSGGYLGRESVNMKKYYSPFDIVYKLLSLAFRRRFQIEFLERREAVLNRIDVDGCVFFTLLRDFGTDFNFAIRDLSLLKADWGPAASKERDGANYIFQSIFRELVPDVVETPGTMIFEYLDNTGALDNKSIDLFDYLTISLEEIGPLICVGEEGAKNNGGPFFIPLDERSWKKDIIYYIEKSRAIILVPGKTPGISWEIDHIAGEAIEKTMFIMPPAFTIISDPIVGETLN